MKRTALLLCLISSILIMGCASKEAAVNEKKFSLYQKALSYIEEKQYPQAIKVMTDLGSFKDSEALTEQLRYVINGAYIAAGWPCIGAVTADSRVLQINAYDDALSTDSWQTITRISSKGMYLEGITADGTIITTDPLTPEMLYDNIINSAELVGAGTFEMCDAAKAISHLKNVKEFISAYPTCCAILTDKHKVEAAGLSNEALAEIKTWDNIVSIAGFLPDVVGLKADGTIAYLSSRYQGEKDKIASWTDIVAISEGTYLFGLKTDGTVVSSGVLAECRTEAWKDIIAISASRITTIGLKRDGTVVAAGDNYYGQCNVEQWTDIVAIAANDYYTLGLTSKGGFVITENIRPEELTLPEVSEVSGLYVPEVIINRN